ncbi:neuroblast differentiation-associated protein AHNAK isoform X5 [Hippocampus zosterae]|uniref:neuroblast differentiation-associated protein AHNAK isoform X5 n=1 Tax=Hippocampus zosterae TaxID=109293 RepID=UPI00223D274C|nr:neuroblast differentiation-associated protein AHNAK isoform X5 [Hippocampus zosterae]
MAAMFSRRRLSDALTLERSERGALVIANIDDVDGANQKLREGDEVVGATIKFDQLSKEEVMGVLKLMEPYDDRIQVLTRNNMSKSMGNLDQLAVSPEMMLRDSYSKLYNTKIKRFMRKDSPDGQNPRDFVQTLPHAARRKTKRDSDLPRLGVDFGRLSPTALVRRFSADSETGRAAYASGAFAQGANLNLPPLGVGQVNAGRRIQVQQRLNDGGRAQAGLVSGIYDDGDDVDAAMALRGTDGRFQAYRLSNGDAKFDVDGYDISQTMHLAGPSSRLNAPGFDLDGRSARSGLRGSTLDVDGPSGDFDVKAPGVIGDFTEPNLHLQGVTAPIPAVRSKVPPGKYKAPKFSMPNFGLPTVEVPRFDGDLPGMDISSPDVRLSKPNIRGLNTTDWSLKSPKIEGAFSGPDLDLKGAGLEMDAPKMPKFSRPNLKGPELDGRLDGLDMDIDAPKFKLGGPGADFGMPDYDLDGPNLDLRSPDLGISGPDLRGGVSASDLEMPRLSLKGPKLDLKSPNLDMPSGKLNMPDLNGPDLNLKAPKLKGGLNGPDWDLPNADLKGGKFDLKTPDINMGSPKAKLKKPKLKMPKFHRPSLKGPDLDADIDGLDMNANAPTLKLKGPNADLGMPNVDIDGKFKKPNLNMPDLDLDGPKVGGLNLDLNSPNLDLSGPNLRGGINGPDMKMPKFDFKSPKLDLKGPNLDLPDLDGPDLNLKAPKIKGGFDGPDLDLPNADLKAPKLDVKTPDINIGSPKTKFKFRKLRIPKLRRPSLKGPDLDVDLDAPDLDINAPTVNLKGSKPNLDLDIGGKFKKPNVNMPNLDVKSPKLDLKAPKMDLSAPDLDVKTPDLQLKAPKLKGGLDVNSPDINMGSPKAKMKMPRIKLPKVNLPTLNGPDIDGPDFDIGAPDVDFGRPSGKYRKPHLKVPDVELSGPNVKSPKYHGKLKGPNAEVNVRAPKVKGSWDTPKAGVPNMDLKAPTTDWNTSDIKYRKPQMKVSAGYDTGLDGRAEGPDLRFPDVRGPNFKPTMSYLDTIDLDGADVSVSGPNAKLRTPDLEVDGSMLKFRKSLHGGSGVPLPGLDLDQDLTHSRFEGMSRASLDADLGHYVDFTRSDLNIDDFTGKYHIPRGRGSDLDLQLPSTSRDVTGQLRGPRLSGTPLNADAILYPSHAEKAAHTLNDGRWSYSQKRAPDTSDGYLVTVFPTQGESENEPKQKHGTLGGLNFVSGDVNLEVPDQDELKGSTYLFSNLV